MRDTMAKDLAISRAADHSAFTEGSILTTGERITSHPRQATILRAVSLFAALACSPLQRAQNPPAAPPAADAQETYAKLCAGCHGADAHGSQQGPGLAGNSGVRRRSVQSLRNVIRRGI